MLQPIGFVTGVWMGLFSRCWVSARSRLFVVDFFGSRGLSSARPV